jgi:hypothetical protein
MSDNKLIYIFGIDRRSGTNFLNRVLLKHPEIKFSNQPGEDFLISASGNIINYVNNVSRNWDESWKGMSINTYKEKLFHSLVEGIEKYMGMEPYKYTLTKTPSTLGIENVLKIFPSAKVIIIVRDGRNLSESGVQSFGWKYENAFKRWNESAKRIDQFLNTNSDYKSQIYLLKYEDLNKDTEDSIKKIFNHFNISDAGYSYDEIKAIPVVGSSTSSPVKGKLDWNVKITKDENFTPNERYKNWDRKTKIKYDEICGEMALQFNYEIFKIKKTFLERFFNH